MLEAGANAPKFRLGNHNDEAIALAERFGV